MPLPLPRWIAHRGGGALAPENTLAGIRLAARLGFTAVEFDVMLSQDGTPVLIHDETLERTTSVCGRVADTPDAVLFSLDAGGGEHIPSLAEAAALCRQYGLLANVEIKPATGYEVLTGEVVAREVAVLWRDAPTPPLLSSFSHEALEVARQVAPALPRGLLYEKVPDDWQTTFQRLGAYSLHCRADRLSNEVLALAREGQVPVLAYTVNDSLAAQLLFGRGVASLFTDRLDLFAPETSLYKSLHLGG
ncbi:glycerophosphodiester phosphodiesterase [Azonexus sp. IMCC34839]|uniref:glycerophosphodiester phosphodiesterase n=1 Tax=Azonexus sp. IMCC34839 TaxID=3133695 RepID=UPI003999BF20